MKIKGTSVYSEKDERKALMANKLIAYGAIGTSTALYARQRSDVCNVGHYVPEDRVFVSINGARRNRIGIEAYKDELQLAVASGASFVTDNDYHRNRPFNVGERELATFLRSHGYEQHGYIWRLA